MADVSAPTAASADQVAAGFAAVAADRAALASQLRSQGRVEEADIVAVAALIQPAQQVLLVLRQVQFGHSQCIKTQLPGQLLQLRAQQRQLGGCKLGQAGHVGPV